MCHLKHLSRYFQGQGYTSRSNGNIGVEKGLLGGGFNFNEITCFSTQFPLLAKLRKRAFENIVLKEENAGNQTFQEKSHGLTLFQTSPGFYVSL